MEYSIEIDASKGLVKATGDKPFVEAVMDKYESLMKIIPSVAAVTAPQVPTQTTTQPNATAAPPDNSGTLDGFGNVFDVTDDKISVIADIPGNTQAAQAKNLCLLYLFARLKLGEAVVPNDDVREICKAHAVYDQTNFASQMKGQKKLVIASGPKGSPNFTLKLTVPGKKVAEELATSLEAAA